MDSELSPGPEEARLENKRIVAAAFEAGIDVENPNIAGIHGTAIEALLQAIETGKLPTEGGFQTEFHILPPTIDEAKRDAEYYARTNAVTYGLYHTFHQDPRFLKYAEDEKIPPEVLEEAPELFGISRTALLARLERLKETRKGVILAISKDATTDFEVIPDEGIEYAQIIKTPSGLPLRYVIGIEPQSDYEYNELEQIQEQAE